MTDTLHYTIIPPMVVNKNEDYRDVQAVLREFREWMASNFEPTSYTYYPYVGSGSVLFSSLDQVFLTRLRWHEIMRPVV